MSESTKIVELNDTSIEDLVLNEEKHLECSKRKISEDFEEEQQSVSKKICSDTSSVIYVETEENKKSEIFTEENLNESKKSNETDSMLDEIKNSDNESLQLDAVEDIADEENDQLTETDNDSSDYDDDTLMMRAINATHTKNAQINSAQPAKVIENEEPIALDDTDDEISNSYSDMNEEEEEEEEQIEEESFPMSRQNHSGCHRKRMLRINARFYYSRILLKKSIKFLSKTSAKKPVYGKANGNTSSSVSIEEPKTTPENGKTNDEQLKIAEEKCEEIIENVLENKKVPEEPEALDTHSSNNIEMKTNANDEIENKQSEEHVSNENIPMAVDDELVPEKNCTEPTPQEESTSNTRTNSHAVETAALLAEISNGSVDDIMNRYVFRNGERISLEEFTEELFYCLQQNKLEILKAQQVWNEQVHIKYKIREIMERIRRHRAVIDIETFGYKPSCHESSTNPVVSSKSSTTTNSENEHFDKASRMSPESMKLFIQNVKGMLKREDKHKIDDTSSNLNLNQTFGDCNNLLSHLNNSSQGRQGQIIDVQSIINDFRQKNPQEIPRQGRRVKKSFEILSNNYLTDPQQPLQFRNESSKSSQELSNSTKISNSSGFPEVSLLPVNNFYKNLTNSPGAPQFGPQKASLLQSILTKQSTKSSAGHHTPNNMPATSSSSTLARLLTAPERSFQSASRHSNSSRHSTKTHNNGEITITPIAGTSKRQHFSMDDEENSAEPPLVIDESEDFDLDRTKAELLCQGCRRNKALFMCAGCSRQWYCSKECQEMSWDDHAESCMV